MSIVGGKSTLGAWRRTRAEDGGDVGPGGVFEVDLHPHALSQMVALPVVLISAEGCSRDRREDVKKAINRFIIPSQHRLV